MNLISKFSLLAIALSAALFSGSAMAEKSTSASVTNLHFELIDLNLNDGTAPGLQFTSMSTLAQQSLGNATTGSTLKEYYNRGTDLKAINHTLALAQFGTQAVARFDGNLDGSSFASGSALGQGFYKSATNVDVEFLLLPYTQLIVTGTLTAQVLNQPGSNFPGLQFADAIVYGYDDFGPFPTQEASVTAVRNQATQTADFRLNFYNPQPWEQYGSFSRFVRAEGNNVLAVPEPESWAMMVAGLGLLGFMVRRRARTAAHAS